MIFGASTGKPLNHIVTESTEESNHLIAEGALIDELSKSELQAFLENATEVNLAIAENIVTEKTIVRLDRNAQISQATKGAIFTIAREKNDPKMKKLMTLWRIERRIEADLEKKYGNEATRRAKKQVDQRRRSKSSTIRKTAKSPTLLNTGKPSGLKK